MWRNDRDRPDDPRTQEQETERLSRDEYDRPRYGSPQSQYGERPGEPTVNDGAVTRDDGHAARQPDDAPIDARRVRAEAEALAYTGQRPEPMRRLEQVRVHELMTRRVASVHPASSVERAVRLMAECDCGALPVLADNGVLVGIVTDRDIALRIVGRGREARRRSWRIA